MQVDRKLFKPVYTRFLAPGVTFLTEKNMGINLLMWLAFVHVHCDP